MVFWRLLKAAAAAFSEAWLRETVISTIEPEEMSGGRSMDGNSIYMKEAVSDVLRLMKP